MDNKNNYPEWPIALAGACCVTWLIPFIGIPVAIATIIGGIRMNRTNVLVCGISSLALAMATAGAHFAASM